MMEFRLIRKLNDVYMHISHLFLTNVHRLQPTEDDGPSQTHSSRRMNVYLILLHSILASHPRNLTERQDNFSNFNSISSEFPPCIYHVIDEFIWPLQCYDVMHLPGLVKRKHNFLKDIA